MVDDRTVEYDEAEAVYWAKRLEVKEERLPWGVMQAIRKEKDGGGGALEQNGYVCVVHFLCKKNRFLMGFAFLKKNTVWWRDGTFHS